MYLAHARLALPAALSWLFACGGPTYYSGKFDQARADKGDLYVDTLELGGGQFMGHAAVVVDAPPWRVWNVMTDVEGYPLWDNETRAVKVLASHADGVEFEAEMKGELWMDLAPVQWRLRQHWERLEVAAVAFENDWLRATQMVIKLKPLEAGERTLVDFYGHFDFKELVLDASDQMKLCAKSLENIRKIALHPRYSKEPSPAPGTRPSALVLPPLRAYGVSDALARTATHRLAEHLMRQRRWTVITHDEVVALLTHAAQTQLLGCEEAGCAVDLAKVLAADLVLSGAVSRAAERYVVDASLLSLPAGEVERRVSRDAAGESDILTHLQTMAAELAGTAP